MGEGAAIYNCLLCDSYALVVLGVLPDRKLARGLKGKAAYDDLLEAFQLEFAGSSETVRLLACPTCNAFARQSGDAPSPPAPPAPSAAARIRSSSSRLVGWRASLRSHSTRSKS